MPNIADRVQIKRALLSVSDKTGIVEFAEVLVNEGVEILSTGGTYRLLQEAGINVIEISEYTGFPEMMSGRVKTLHPKVHGGILARRGTDESTMAEHGIKPIDLVVVNLYPFEKTVAQPDCELSDAIENIDIGGPTLVRAAAKNYNDVAVIVNTTSYPAVITELQLNSGTLSREIRFELAVQAFEHVAAYDDAIANYLGSRASKGDEKFPRTFNTQFIKSQVMRYGENPHQEAAFYVEKNNREASVSSAFQYQGKELSFNNIADTDAAIETVKLFDKPACVIVKHANPCGAAQAGTILEAYQKAFDTDPESAFGGIIAINRELDEDTARAILEKQFVEVIVAPSISVEAANVMSSKKNVRLLSCGDFGGPATSSSLDFKRVTGGLLVQDRDTGMVSRRDLEIVSARHPSEDEIRDLLFAWKIAKMVKSNAIVYAKDCRTIGIGAGQMSRVNSARIAAIKAEHAGFDVTGSVMASDAFFPFRDGIDNAAGAGITAVIQPGGSVRDEEVIAAADEHGMAMIFTDMRHFRH